jgi:hypothetical protein
MDNFNSVKPILRKINVIRGGFPSFKPEGKNEFKNYDYIKIEQILDAVETEFPKQELGLFQNWGVKNGILTIYSIIYPLDDNNDAYLISSIEEPIDKPFLQIPQLYGSAITYGHRYQLKSMLGITTDKDDDGVKAQFPNGQQNNNYRNNVRQGNFNNYNNNYNKNYYNKPNHKSLAYKSRVDKLIKDVQDNGLSKCFESSLAHANWDKEALTIEQCAYLEKWVEERKVTKNG